MFVGVGVGVGVSRIGVGWRIGKVCIWKEGVFLYLSVFILEDISY